jgi:uncharacterized protein YjiS (DUF1127 family)
MPASSEPVIMTLLSQRAAEGVVRIAVHDRQKVLGEMLGAMLGTLWLWAQRRQTRRRLRDIAEDPRLLSDIGLARTQALREADKVCWLP